MMRDITRAWLKNLGVDADGGRDPINEAPLGHKMKGQISAGLRRASRARLFTSPLAGEVHSMRSIEGGEGYVYRIDLNPSPGSHLTCSPPSPQGER